MYRFWAEDDDSAGARGSGREDRRRIFEKRPRLLWHGVSEPQWSVLSPSDART